MTNDITIIKTSDSQVNQKSLEICLKEESIRDTARCARELFSTLQVELDDIEDDLKDGLSYLDMKNDTLLSYMIDLCNIVLRKVRGETISGHPSIERGVYYRVILEKIKAIDQKLAYQLNKVITMPDDATEEEQGVNINNLDIDLGSDDDDGESSTHAKRHGEAGKDEDDEDEDDESDEDEDGISVISNSEESDIAYEKEGGSPLRDVAKISAGSSKKPAGVYKPPKLRSVAYNDGTERNPKRRRDYNDFYQNDDDVQDIVEESRSHRDDERTRYEEENYTRLPTINPRKLKRKLREKKAKVKGSKKLKSASKRR